MYESIALLANEIDAPIFKSLYSLHMINENVSHVNFFNNITLFDNLIVDFMIVEKICYKR